MGLDWEEFTLTTLDNPRLQRDVEEFPILQFFARIPEGDMKLAVYGLPVPGVRAADGRPVYEGLVLRSLDVSPDQQNQSLSGEPAQ